MAEDGPEEDPVFASIQLLAERADAMEEALLAMAQQFADTMGELQDRIEKLENRPDPFKPIGGH